MHAMLSCIVLFEVVVREGPTVFGVGTVITLLSAMRSVLELQVNRV